MDVMTALARCGGVARTGGLRRLGVTEREIAVSVAAGTVRRVRHGVLALPSADPAVVLAAHLGGVATCVTALAVHGVLLLQRSRTPHVAVRDDFGRRGRHINGARLHYSTDILGSRSEQIVHPVARALDTAGRCLDARAHLVAVDSALHQGLLRSDEVAAFTVTPRERRDWLLAHADPRSESVGETLARLDVVERGLPVHPQRFVTGVGRIDLVVADKVAVEVDGHTFHGDPESFRRDRRRDRKVVAAGMPVLRFAHGELIGADAVHVGDAVLDLLRRMQN